jgi:hypothetical protein
MRLVPWLCTGTAVLALGACASTFGSDAMTPERLAEIRRLHEPRWIYLPDYKTSARLAHFIDPRTIERSGSVVRYTLLGVPAKPSFGGVGLGAVVTQHQSDCSSRTSQLRSIQGYKDDAATEPVASGAASGGPSQIRPGTPNEALLDSVCSGRFSRR